MPACQSGRHVAKRGTEWESCEQMAEREPCVPNINNRQTEEGRLSPCVCVCPTVPLPPGDCAFLQTFSYSLQFFFLPPLVSASIFFPPSLTLSVSQFMFHPQFRHKNVQNTSSVYTDYKGKMLPWVHLLHIHITSTLILTSEQKDDVFPLLQDNKSRIVKH